MTNPEHGLDLYQKMAKFLTDVDGEEIKLQGRQSVVEFLRPQKKTWILLRFDDDIAKAIPSNVC